MKLHGGGTTINLSDCILRLVMAQALLRNLVRNCKASLTFSGDLIPDSWLVTQKL